MQVPWFLVTALSLLVMTDLNLQCDGRILGTEEKRHVCALGVTGGTCEGEALGSGEDGREGGTDEGREGGAEPPTESEPGRARCVPENLY